MPAKKKTAKKPARKIARKPVRKVAAKKPVRRPAPLRRAVPRKAAPRKAAAQRAKPRKVAARKRPARKTAAKKPAARKRSPRKPAHRGATAARAAPRKAAATRPARARRVYGVGRFVWYDLLVHDVDRAVDFYTKLFGWTTQTMDMGPAGPYTMFAANGVTFGGAAKLPLAAAAPQWMAYVGVADLDATCSAAQRAGGAVVVPPTPIPQVGRFAVLADPLGATIAPMECTSPPMRDLDAPPAPGLVVWNEIVTPDPAKTGTFYADLFGWRRRPMPVPDGTTYDLLGSGDKNEVGILQPPPGLPPACKGWLFYFNVADVDAAAARAQELGGRIFSPPRTIPGVCRMAILGDPAGATFALFQPEKT